MSESDVYERFKNLIKSQSYKVYTIYDIPIGTMLEISEIEWIVTNKDYKELLFVELYCVILAEYWINEENHDSTKLYDPIEMIYHHFDWLTLACCLWCHDVKIIHEPKEYK